jgi:biopolymer transport protein ExbB
MNSIILAIQDGGVWMAPIIISFVFALAIAAERAFFILSAKSNKTALMSSVKSAVMSGSPTKAVNECAKLAEKKQVLPAVLLVGLKAANRSVKEVEAEMEQATLEQFPKLTQRMAFLPVLANVATLSGLLGTIIGLIEAFDAVASAAPDQKQIMLAKGISKAMYTTAGGLVVAIPTLVINSILTSMVTGIMDQVDQSSAELVNKLRANKRSEAAK